ncbi:early activation antigen CD69-like isoform X2 [Rana temporaria]|uniref:early activation antigen CD69-like isoform X2 n=1 Tax=Rana temporaria TaxID=8407 RepID=UPI001AADAF40|nr:early activation antigen CD69-like isoform X2 [Rana temporaria]
MGDAVTYSEMTFTNKHNSRIPSGSVQNEEEVTYAAVKNKSEGKKKKKKTKSNLTQQVSPQPEVSAPTYAKVNKLKKEKNKKPAKTEEVSPQAEDKSLLYTPINKPNRSAQKDNTTTTKTQKEHPPAYEDLKIPRKSTENGHTRPKTLLFRQFSDGRHVKLLLGVLLAICLILLITAISLAVGCREAQDSGSRAPGTSGSNQSSGRSPRCPDLWISINDKCYFLSENKMTRSLSDKDCTERGSRLAQVKEKTLQRLVTITGKEFWVGLTQYHSHGGVWTGKWADGSMETVTEGIGTCAKLGSRLTLENCFTELNYICERDTV